MPDPKVPRRSLTPRATCFISLMIYAETILRAEVDILPVTAVMKFIPRGSNYEVRCSAHEYMRTLAAVVARSGTLGDRF